MAFAFFFQFFGQRVHGCMYVKDKCISTLYFSLVG